MKRDRPIMGVRTWRVDLCGFLRSPTELDLWEPRKDRHAGCTKSLLPHATPPPAPGCGCGLYAFYDMACWRKAGGRVDGIDLVCGVVSAWGAVEEAEYGYRSESMRVEGIVQTHDSIPVLGQHVSLEPMYRALAERYGVPLLMPQQVESFMREWGGTMLRLQDSVDDIVMRVRGGTVLGGQEWPG